MTQPPPHGRGLRRLGRRRIALLAFAGTLVALVAATAWLLAPQPLLPEAEAALVSTPAVAYADEGDWLAYRPASGTATTGLIMYPGAKVDAAGYAPTARAIAERGYAVFVVKMPANLAILGADRADAVRTADPSIEHWALWGHSLGGAMAGQHAAGRAGAYAGIAFCGAYPNGDLSGQALDAVSIYGTLDSGVERITSAETRASLPGTARFVPIEGGNHQGCGWYTGQAGDPPATIPREEQQRQIVDATVAMLDRISGVAGALGDRPLALDPRPLALDPRPSLAARAA